MDILQTDWAAMTLNDWAGLIITVGVFFLMVWAYVSTFNPKNKEKLESKSSMIFDEDNDMDDLTSTHSTSTKGDSKK
ncbi:MAG: CcoQ/FixQ family Cbb3-type cytochrome c oxidase assembly chaperone [endosymbiont of Galathealinum brachiosum]|uniref:CcoQ/FixQ family Cbb3-type cytochrome c oxidase assembly chaperone n=1 Tax=endosymbiont of Galathealinum brachiosum TaxID=2200906 RepID=A0A370DMB8_9GAMM|nr:MAG: CcoQ/FixQ family Cbb3-type cytochrome c oxidase assembly chaperone [endosymbiont of Galathealinum brachiosum]